MKFYTLASGSKGNATLVAHQGKVLLIDMGLTLTMLKERLEATPYQLEDIKAILYTHSHSDHLKPLKTFPMDMCYATKETYDVPVSNQLTPYERYDILGFSVTVLPTSHDANNSVGYVLETGDEKLVYMTDTGYISERNIAYMKDADYYILESNHNIRMLLKTNRPYDLIQRILGDSGHLSNEDAAMYLTEMIGQKTKEIVLAHISEEANTPDVALETCLKIFHSQRIPLGQLLIRAAPQWEVLVGGKDEN